MSENKVVYMDIEDMETEVLDAVDALEFAGKWLNTLLEEARQLREENKRLKAALEEKS